MSRYIDTDQIKYSRVIIRTEKDEHGFSEKVEYVASVKEIDAMPTADVVPVVRCKDCSLGEARQRKTGEHIIHCSYTNRTMNDGDFCSNGRVIK